MTEVRRLHPAPSAPTTIVEAYTTPTRVAPPGRPYVMVTMIASVDGSAVVAGSSAALGNTTDAAVIGATRSVADVIVVGVATARADRYGPPRREGQRIGVVTSRGDVNTDTPLFTSGAGFLIMPKSGPHRDRDVPTLRVGDERVDLFAALTRLHEIAGPVAVVGVEGGPTLNALLAAEGLVDELNVTISPVIAGGDGHRLARGADSHLGLELAHVLADDESYLFTRWLARR